MNSWTAAHWGDLCTLAYGRAIKGYQNRSSGYRVYGTNGPIGFWHMPLQEVAGLIIGRKGAYRGVHYSKDPFYVIDTAYAMRVKSNVEIRWAYYSLLNVDINSMDSGSAIPSTSRDEFYGIPTLLPPISEQRAIAETLGALDDKIELNRKTSATLEAMARALYRSWFVDFDPVHAKAEGHAPAHMDAPTAALFPNEFDSDGYPVGWHEGCLSDLILFNPTERIRKGQVLPYLDMKALPTSGLTTALPIPRPFTSGTKFRALDTLLARITPCLENGKTGMVASLGDSGLVGWGSTEFIVMRAKDGVPPSLPYCVARDQEFRLEAIASMTGSSGRQRASAERIASLPIAVPDIRVLEAFSQLTVPMIDRIHALGKESQTLAQLRDTLLPRLMSGELRVKAAEEMIEEAL